MIDGFELQYDYAVMINGQDVSKDCPDWLIHDNEEAYSSISIHLVNTDFKYSGKFQPGCPISIRIAPQMKWWPVITMRMMKFHERSGKHGMMIEFIGCDAMEKMARKEASRHMAGTRPIPAIQQMANESGVTVQTDINNNGVDGGGQGCNRIPQGNQDNLSKTKQIGDRAYPDLNSAEEPPNPGYSGGEAPADGSPPDGAAQNQKASSGVNYAGGNDNSRLTNAQKRAASKIITAHLSLAGTALRGQQNVTLAHAGPVSSGVWYVKDSTISGGDKGLRCVASLMRGAITETNQGTGATPVVMYADIYLPDTIYMGPRKVNSPSQATLTFGVGDFIENLESSFDAVAAMRASKKALGKPIDPNDASSPIKEKSSDGGTPTPEPSYPDLNSSETPPSIPTPGQ